MVLIDVHARLFGALKGHTRTGNLSQAIDIVGLDAQSLLNIVAHFLRPGFGAEDTGFEGDVVRAHAQFFHGFCEISGITGGAAQDRR